MIFEGKIGSKGELFIPKKIRDKLGLKPNMKVIYRLDGDRIIIEPIPTIEDILKEKPEVHITLEEFYKFRRELSKKAES